MVESIFPLITYSNCKIKDCFWLRYTSVAQSLTMLDLFWVVFSGILVKEVLLLSNLDYLSSSNREVRKFATLWWHLQNA